MDPTLFSNWMSQNIGAQGQGGALGGGTGTGLGGGGGASGYMPSYQQPTSGAYQSGVAAPTSPDINGVNNIMSQAGAGMNQMYNQYAPGAMQNAQGQGQYMQNLGNQLSGAYGGLQSGANSIMNTAFDPQNALYNRTQQQLQDQINSANSMNGTAMTPYGAGVGANAMSNFNIDWQAQQLQNQATGLGAAGTALGQYGAGVTGGQNLAQAGVQLPTSQQSNLFANQNSALAPYQAVSSNQLQQQQLAQQQEALAMQWYQQQNQQNQQQYQNQMGMFSGLGGALGKGIGAVGSAPSGSLFNQGGTSLLSLFGV